MDGLYRKVAVITGGAKGIGAATAEYFAERGYRVAIIYNTSEEQANALVRRLNANDLRAVAYRANIACSAETDNALEQIKRVFGRIDVLVNNAGVSSGGLLMDTSDREWRRVMGVNLDGAFYASRKVIGYMLEAGEGSIVNVSSVWGVYGASCEVAYSCSKAGLIGFTKALARELGGGIRVNCVAPGVIDTDMNKCYTAEEIEALNDITPIGRMGSAREVAEAIYFMATNSYITGEVLEITGGFRG